MAVQIRPPSAVHYRPPRAVCRTVRKVGICGAHTASLADAPWDDPSWELWGHASAWSWYPRALDRYFDLHPLACWTRGGKKTAAYPRWLAKNTVPIYMQERYPEVPASMQYPKGRILAEYGAPRPYFTNQTAWMVALALSEGVTHLGLFGVNYGTDSEYMLQRGSAEYWLGRAAERGIHVVLTEQCSLLREPALLYGYESHDEVTGALREEYQRKAWKPTETIRSDSSGRQRAIPPPHLVEQMRIEERENPRPDWALGPLPDRTDSGMIVRKGEP